MKCLPPEEAFLALEQDDAVDYNDAKAVVIPFGLEASVTYGGGTAKGPAAMLSASHEVELFDEQLWCEPYRQIGIVTLPEPEIQQPISTALDQLEGLVEQVVQDGKFPMVFGGEHAITPGAIRPLLKRYPDMVMLHFDAHADLRDGYMGEHFSHASAIRRCLDNEQLSVVSLGIRNISAGEIPFYEANRERVHIYWAYQKQQWNREEIVSHFKGKPVYITVDVDGFDASLMPATGTPEPGGLFWQEVVDVIQQVCQVSSQVIGADINELSPIPGQHSCDFLAAKLAYKIMSFALS